MKATRIDRDKLNDARWAAVNTRYVKGYVPTLEEATEAVDRGLCAYLGIDWDEFVQLVRDVNDA